MGSSYAHGRRRPRHRSTGNGDADRTAARRPSADIISRHLNRFIPTILVTYRFFWRIRISISKPSSTDQVPVTVRIDRTDCQCRESSRRTIQNRVRSALSIGCGSIARTPFSITSLDENGTVVLNKAGTQKPACLLHTPLRTLAVGVTRSKIQRITRRYSTTSSASLRLLFRTLESCDRK